jgi:hypothetical protein
MFDQITAATLANAGWFDGRSVDVEHWAGVLRAEGIEVHEPGRAFLAEFGGLSVEQSGWGVSRARVLENRSHSIQICVLVKVIGSSNGHTRSADVSFP